MDTHFQDLQWVIDRSTKQFKAEPNKEIAPLFKNLRKDETYSLLGDYFILWAMSESLRQIHRPVSRNAFKVACRYSEEYKQLGKRDKMMWLDNFCGTWKKDVPSHLKTIDDAHSEDKKVLKHKR